MTTLITGATAGIGRETAFKMATFDSNLILPVRNLSKGEKLKTEILAQNPNITVDLFECDFNSLVSIKSFVDLLAAQNQKFQIYHHRYRLYYRYWRNHSSDHQPHH